MDKKSILMGMIILAGIIIAIAGVIVAEDTGLLVDSKFDATVQTDMSPFIKDGFNPKFGAITLSDKLTTNKIAEYSLTSTTESIIDIGMEGKATLYEDGTLFDDVVSKDVSGKSISVNGDYYILITKDNFINITLTYKQECFIPKEGELIYGIPAKVDAKEVCYNVSDKIELQNKPITEWKLYNGETLKAGDYQWKWEGKRTINQKIDIQPIKDGKDFSEWVWYDASWTKKKAVYLNVTWGADKNQTSSLINVTYDSDMQTDFDDLRFTDGTETTELSYWFYNNSYVASNSVQVWVNTSTLGSAANKTIYMYYGNALATTTSNINNTFMFGDDFTSLDTTNKWQMNYADWAVSGGIVTGTGASRPQSILEIKTGTYNDYMIEARHQKTNDDNLAAGISFHPTSYTIDWNDVDWSDSAFGVRVGASEGHAAYRNTNWNRMLWSMPASGSAVGTWNNDTNGFIYNFSGTPSARTTYIGLMVSQTGAVGKTDWIYVRRYVPSEPIITFGTEEMLTTYINITGKVVLTNRTSVPNAQIWIFNMSGYLIGSNTSNATGDWIYTVTNGTIINYTVLGFNPANKTQGASAYPYISQ